MSTPVQRRARMPIDPERPPSLSTSPTLVFEMCSAGARPKTTPVARQTSAKNANTPPSILNSMKYGLPTSWVAASNRLIPTMDSANPKTPLMSASRTLSTSSCRTIRQRVAPSDTRTLISRDRPVARASSRLATFEHAISSTNATAPISDRKMIRIGPCATCSL